MLTNSRQGKPSVVAAAFIAAFLVSFFATKFQGFQYGNAIDDYFNRFADLDGAINFVMSQGRFTWAAFLKVAQISGLNQMDFIGVGMLSLGLAIAFYFWVVFRRFFNILPIFLAVAVALVLGAHPYMTEYVSFRITLVPMAIMMSLCGLSIILFEKTLSTKKWYWLISAVLAAGFAIGANQLAVSFISIGAIFVQLGRCHEELCDRNDAIAWPILIRMVVRAAIFTLLSVITFFVLWKLLQVGLGGGAGSDQRATIIGASEIPKRLGEVKDLLILSLFKNENFFSSLSKMLILAAISAVAIGAAINRNWKSVAISAILLVIAILLSIGPVSAAAVWWPVPRTLIAIPFGLAGIIVMLGTGATRTAQSLAAGILVFAAMVLGAHSTRILLDQQRLNRWDAATAMRIVEKVETSAPEARKLALVNPAYTYDIGQSLPTGDMNVSALSVPYAVDPLFEEVTGKQKEVRLAPELANECLTKPKFPKEGSVYLKSDEAVICM